MLSKIKISMRRYLGSVKQKLTNTFKSIKAFLNDLTPQSKEKTLKVFAKKTTDNTWAGKNSLSGHGSDFVSTENLRQILPSLIQELNVKSLLDAPCGDFYWMNLTDLQIDNYIGVDIVPELVEQNQLKYSSKNRQFINLDIILDELPNVDLILCRDCLVHLSFNQIKESIQNFKKSGSTYLLTTTYPDLLDKNKNIVTGDWRPLDLEKPPFNFPKPIKLVNENCTTDLKEKSLGLWKISDI